MLGLGDYLMKEMGKPGFKKSLARIKEQARKARLASPGIGRACHVCGGYGDDHSKACHFPPAPQPDRDGGVR